jgi:hypothetical protein
MVLPTLAAIRVFSASTILRARSFFCEAPIKHKTFLHYKNVMSASWSKRVAAPR